MPAFGAFTGGLNVRDAAFADVFGTLAFTAHMLGDGPALCLLGEALFAGLIAAKHHAAEPADEQRHQRDHQAINQPVIDRRVGDILFDAGLDNLQRRGWLPGRSRRRWRTV